MSKFILLEGNYLTRVDNIEFCVGSLESDCYCDENGETKQWFCELTKIKLKQLPDNYIYYHVFKDFLQAIEEGMKSDDPIIKPRVATKDDWY